MPEPVPCHYCNMLVEIDNSGEVYSTHPRNPMPWYCFASANGKHLIHADLRGKDIFRSTINHRSVYMRDMFEEWRASSDFTESFWSWMHKTGRMDQQEKPE